jgi:DNA-binding CsgD family transcriptional regulator
VSLKFESVEWHAAVGDVIAASDCESCASALDHAIRMIVSHEGTCLLAFHKNARPEVVHHTLEPAGQEHYVERYLAGPYLLDPLYLLALQDEKPTLCRFRDQLPDRFHSSPYYRQYCEQTHLQDEMDYLATVSEETTLALVVGRRSSTFRQAELRHLHVIEPTIRAAIVRIWQFYSGDKQAGSRDDAVHRRLTECFDQFGANVLTDRERQISQLLLRGHSSKAAARLLEIAPGTVMVHKRNLFAKLGISSQYELFSLYIDALSTE